VKADASAKGDCVGSITLAVELDEDVEGDVGVPKGRHRRRFVGRWLIDSQSKERFNVAHAMISANLFSLSIRERTRMNENT
jgi:hypothetical protein